MRSKSKSKTNPQTPRVGHPPFALILSTPMKTVNLRTLCFLLYANGGYGFGMRKHDLPADHWVDGFAEWLDLQGFSKK